jgi:hypothetical protein
MSQPTRTAFTLALVALAFGAGYGLARWEGNRVDIPTREVREASVPPGLATELRQALLLDDSFERTSAVSRILTPLGADALPDVRAAYDSVILDLGDIELVLFVEWWGRFDPAAAFAWAHESQVAWHPAMLSAIGRAWGRRDPETASAEILASVKDARLLNASLLGLARGWDESGQPGLEAFLTRATAESGEAYALAIDALARARILREGPEAAMAWADAFPDGEQGAPSPIKLLATQRVAGVLVETDPQRAGDWAAAKRGPDYGIGLLLKVGTAWAERDPEAALRWLEGLPSDRDLPTVIQETYHKWFTDDMAAASRWLEGQTLEPWLDPALSTYAQWKTRESFEAAMDWAQRIHDPKRREVTVGKIALAWLRKSPDEADAWLARTELPDSTRERIASLRKIRIDERKPPVRASPPAAGGGPPVPLAPPALPPGAALPR